jgi:hypothetical protein
MHSAAYRDWRTLALGDLEGFSPFSLYYPVDILKSQRETESEGNERYVVAPLTEPTEDAEGEGICPVGVLKGMDMFWSLGAPVDLEHKWERTGDLQFLIGKGVKVFKAAHPKTGTMVPWLRSRLSQVKPLAKSVWEHLCDPDSTGLGYSIAGGAIRKAGTKILETIITSVAITARPVQTLNAGTAYAVTKALQEAESKHIPLEELELPLVPELLGILTPFPCTKALGVAGGLALRYSGGTGGEALATEDLSGDPRRRKRRRRHDEDDRRRRHKSLDPELMDALAGRLALLRQDAAGGYR